MSELPVDWQFVTLGKATNIVMGQSPPSDDYNTIGAGKPFLQGKAEFTHFNPKPIKHCTKALKIGSARSVLMSVRAPVGDVNVADQDYIIGRGLAALRLKKGDDLFLFYALLHSKERIAALGSGSTFQSINRSTLDGFEIILPPLPEQQAIAATLRAVQETRDARRRELAIERERKAALMEDLFTGGVRGEARKETEIGLLPQSWRVASLGNLISEGPQNGLYRHASDYGDGIPIIRINDFDNDGQFITKSFNRVRLPDADVKRYGVNVGDLLINRVNSLTHIGKCALVLELTEPTVFESNMMRFRVNPSQLICDFLRRFLTLDGTRERIRSIAKRAVAQSSINQSDVRGLSIPLPSLDEQKDIAAVLTACDTKIAALEAEATLHDELFRVLLEELLTGKILTNSENLMPSDYIETV